MRRWLAQVRLAADLHRAAPGRITLEFGHDGRAHGMFSGAHAWMVDPVSCTLEPAPAEWEAGAGVPVWEVRGSSRRRCCASPPDGPGPAPARSAPGRAGAVQARRMPSTMRASAPMASR